MSSAQPLVDPLYPFGFEDGVGTAPGTIDFADILGSPSAEPAVHIAEAASALMRLLDWFTVSRDFRLAGAKIHALQLILNPLNSKYRNLSAVAAASGISRDVLSQAFLNLHSVYGIRIIAPQNPMKTSTTEVRTLSQARDRIAELERQLAAANTPKPAPAVSPPPRVTTPPIKPTLAQASPSLPRIEDLSARELSEAMDICNREKDTETLGMLYRELNNRRRKG